MRILYTSTEGSIWTPLYLHNVTGKDLIDNLVGNKEVLDIEYGEHFTLIKDIVTSSIKSSRKLQRDLLFHSLMIENGLIFDTTFHYLGFKDSLDYSFFEIRNFGLSAHRFNELWKLYKKRKEK